MTLQYSEALRNAQLNQFEVIIASSPRLQLRTGPPPANVAAADTGTLIAQVTLPSDWMQDANGGVKPLLGVWAANALIDGSVGHFRIKNTALTITHCQGTVTIPGGGGDMTTNNVDLVTNQGVTIVGFTLTAGNA